MQFKISSALASVFRSRCWIDLLYKVYGLKEQTFVSIVFFLCFSARFMSIHDICYNLWMLLVSVYIYTFHCRLQDISSGYWVLVLHFTRREAVRQIDELQHIATNLGRSEASLLDQHTHMWSTWRVNYYWAIIFVVCRSCVAIPGTERELFRELSSALSGEPSTAA